MSLLTALFLTIPIFKTWQTKFPHHILIGKEQIYYAAHGKSALILGEVLEKEIRFSKRGKASISTTNLNNLLSKLDASGLSYIIYDGKETILYRHDGDDPYLKYPSTARYGLPKDLGNVLQSICALEDGINPLTGEFFQEDSFVYTDIAKEILTLARNGLRSYTQKEDLTLQYDSPEPKAIPESKEHLNISNDDPEKLGAYGQYKQKLINNGLVKAYESWSKEEDYQLIQEYKSKTITQIADIHKRTPGAIRSRLKKLNLLVEDDTEEKSYLKPFIEPFLNPEIVETIFKAEDCHTYRKGDCGGVSCNPQDCPDFIPAVNVSNEEMASWPKYGDASALRIGDKNHFKG